MRVVAAALLGLIGIAHGRHERDGQFVRAVGEQVVDVEAVAAVAVLGLRHRVAVEFDRGHGVEPVRHQVMAVRAIVMPIEAAREPPVDIADPLLLGLVVTVERVVDQAGVEQVERGFARHGRGDACNEPVAQLGRRHLRVHRGERPAAVQRGESGWGVGHGVLLVGVCAGLCVEGRQIG